MAAGFAARVAVARSVSQTDYGLFTLTLACVSTIGTLASLGLQEGTTTLLARHSSEGRASAAPTIKAALVTGGAASLLCAVLLFNQATRVAVGVFATPALVTPLRIAAISIPLMVWTNILVGSYRGQGHILPKVVFQDVLRGLGFVALLVALPPAMGDAVGPYAAISASHGLALGAFIAYAHRRGDMVGWLAAPWRPRLYARPLLSFSLPIMGLIACGLAVSTADTLVLGALLPASDVALYGAAQPISLLFALPLQAAALSYLPLAARQLAATQTAQAGSTYATVSRVLLLYPLPFVLTVVVYAPQVLAVVYGPAYAPAALALQILAVAYYVHGVLGLSAYALTAAGRLRVLLTTAVCGAVLAPSVAIAAVPHLGLCGAAVAASTALIATDVVRLPELRAHVRTQRLGIRTVTPAICTTAAAVLLGLLFAWRATIVGLLVVTAIHCLFLVCFVSAFGQWLPEERRLLRRLSARALRRRTTGVGD